MEEEIKIAHGPYGKCLLLLKINEQLESAIQSSIDGGPIEANSIKHLKTWYMLPQLDIPNTKPYLKSLASYPWMGISHETLQLVDTYSRLCRLCQAIDSQSYKLNTSTLRNLQSAFACILVSENHSIEIENDDFHLHQCNDVIELMQTFFINIDLGISDLEPRKPKLLNLLKYLVIKERIAAILSKIDVYQRSDNKIHRVLAWLLVTLGIFTPTIITIGYMIGIDSETNLLNTILAFSAALTAILQDSKIQN